MKQIVIGLAGQAGSGKDTFATHLERCLYFESVSFADPLKHCVQFLFQLSNEQMEDRELKEKTDERYGLSPRQLMQMFGTEFVRKMIHVNFWVNRMEELITKQKIEERIVITDVRFPNEANMIRQHGTLFHIVRPNNPYLICNKHTSEQTLEIHTNDVVIENRELDRSLSNFEEAVKNIYWKELAEAPKNKW